jgi:starch phosphorylase
MEIALEPDIPTYSGGLGVLAGDTIFSAADLGVPMVAVSLLYRRGYFTQRLGADGWQQEEPTLWPVEQRVQEQPPRVTIAIEGRTVHLRAWKYEARGLSGHVVPVYFLDADLPENAEQDRGLTHTLYGGDTRYRLCQEAILGLGGFKMLRALGHRDIDRFHMNEGHASLLTVALLEEQRAGANGAPDEQMLEAVRTRCVFTTHTPVPAGHDSFPAELAKSVLGRPDVEPFMDHDTLNMTHLALNLSGYVNGVAKKHGEVSQRMFQGYDIEAITNGVHVGRWAAAPFAALFDRYIPEWRRDNYSLRSALGIPPKEIWDAHVQAKQELIGYVNGRTKAGFKPEVLTLGFARRVATYKRADLIFRDLERLRGIAADAGAFQIVFAGKAHPHDSVAKELMKQIFQAKASLQSDIKIAYLENYDMTLGKLITAGVDVWLNTPQAPLEASGTSGMKAALNGVPSLSILDGWWVEGHIEGVTGWSIGDPVYGGTVDEDRSARDAASLYDKLKQFVLPAFYRHREKFIDVMRHAIALNGSFFNTQRMVQAYVLEAYFR